MRIIYLDTETTGTKTDEDRIIELAISIQDEGKEIVNKVKRFNPGIPISQGAMDAHGITNEDLKDEEPFSKFAKSIYELIITADYIAGYNSNRFDVPILYYEFLRSGIKWDYTKHKYLDGMVLYTKYLPRTLMAAHKDLAGFEFEGAHGALADTLATKTVIDCLIENGTFESFEQAEELCRFENADLHGNLIYNEAGEIVYNIGKPDAKGKTIAENINFGQWMLKNDFPQRTKEVLQMEIAKAMKKRIDP